MFSAAIFAVMVAPLVAHLGPGQSLIGTGVTEAFFIEIKVALLAGLVLASPYIFLQIWRFIAPGLTGSEKKLVIPFVAMRDSVFRRRLLFLLPNRPPRSV